jgi:hypothetical protein
MDAKGTALGVFPTREFAVAFINAHAARPKGMTGGGGMQTKQRIPRPIFRRKLAYLRRVTRKTERKRQCERELHAAEYAAYESQQSQLIKREEIERGRG